MPICICTRCKKPYYGEVKNNNETCKTCSMMLLKPIDPKYVQAIQPPIFSPEEFRFQVQTGVTSVVIDFGDENLSTTGQSSLNSERDSLRRERDRLCELREHISTELQEEISHRRRGELIAQDFNLYNTINSITERLVALGSE